jgi:hypothetical protein
VDEEGNVYQLKNEGATKPIAVEKRRESNKTELETLLEASRTARKMLRKIAIRNSSSEKIAEAIAGSRNCVQ